MRATGLLAVLFAVPAAAEPNKPMKPGARAPTIDLPDLVKELVDPGHGAVKRDGVVGIDGTLASGIVVTPPAHPDAELAPRGAWIIPPDPNDPMALELGTNQLRSREHEHEREPWLPRDLSRKLKRGADKVWDLVIPKL